MKDLIDILEEQFESYTLSNCPSSKETREEYIFEIISNLRQRWSDLEEQFERDEIQIEALYERIEMLSDMAYCNGDNWED